MKIWNGFVITIGEVYYDKESSEMQSTLEKTTTLIQPESF